MSDLPKIDVCPTPFKKNVDLTTKKSVIENEKELLYVQKTKQIIDSNVDQKFGKLNLSDRFELITIGYEIKTKRIKPITEREVKIYRKEKSSAQQIGSYGYYRQPIPTAREYFNAKKSVNSSSSTSCTPSSSNENMFSSNLYENLFDLLQKIFKFRISSRKNNLD